MKGRANYLSKKYKCEIYRDNRFVIKKHSDGREYVGWCCCFKIINPVMVNIKAISKQLKVSKSFISMILLNERLAKLH